MTYSSLHQLHLQNHTTPLIVAKQHYNELYVEAWQFYHWLEAERFLTSGTIQRQATLNSHSLLEAASALLHNINNSFNSRHKGAITLRLQVMALITTVRSTIAHMNLAIENSEPEANLAAALNLLEAIGHRPPDSCFCGSSNERWRLHQQQNAKSTTQLRS